MNLIKKIVGNPISLALVVIPFAVGTYLYDVQQDAEEKKHQELLSSISEIEKEIEILEIKIKDDQKQIVDSGEFYEELNQRYVQLEKQYKVLDTENRSLTIENEKLIKKLKDLKNN